MSGITGYIKTTETVPDGLAGRMCETIRYGAEVRTEYWNDDFLSISRVHHGVTSPEPQPLFNENHSIGIVIYGEIFNYDVRSCLRLYEEEGIQAFEKFNGSFCIVLYHLDSHELLFVSDRFASRSLFYYPAETNTLIFGTQLSSILQYPGVPREPDMAAVFEFFTFQQVLGTKTLYKDIRVLPPASILRFRGCEISITTYWERKYKETGETRHSEKYYVEALADAVKESVSRCLSGNHDFGLLLSGGLDSRMILAAADKKPVCFTFGDFENREVKTAERIARTKGCKHIFLQRDLDHYVNLVDEAVKIGGGMYSFFHAHSIGFFDSIRPHCDVLLHGFSIEPFFRGTNLPHKTVSFLGKNLFTYLEKVPEEELPRKIIEKLKFSYYHLNPKQLFTEPFAAAFDEALSISVKGILNETTVACPLIYDKFVWFVTHQLGRYAPFLCEASIRPYMDERSFVMDNHLLDLHLEMPVKYRRDSRLWKKVLRKLDPKIAEIPDANTGYSPYMPRLFVYGMNVLKKVAGVLRLFKLLSLPDPFSLPDPIFTQSSWPNLYIMVRLHEKMKALVEETFRDPACIDPAIFSIPGIEKVYKDYLAGKDEYVVFLYLLLTFGKKESSL
jgi:asparagine synthase (glutamine-hydrolysing)